MSPHARNLRVGRHSEIDCAYHVTATTLNRKPHFSDLHAARTLIQCLQASDQQGHTQTLAFVVMPDHFHWLFVLAEGALSDTVAAVKSVSAHRIGARIWQPGYYDHGVRREEDLRSLARYIIANPVRAGLVESVRDYPHWDAVWL